MQEMKIWSLDQEDSLEESMATHSSILIWEISWTVEPDGGQSIESQRDTTKQLILFIYLFICIWQQIKSHVTLS